MSASTRRLRRLAQRERESGFTLLEVLIALGILSMGLLVIMRVQDQAVMVEQYQDQQIVAATLARWKMAEIELQLEKKGFGSEESKEECGKFGEEIEDKGFDDFEYCWTLTKVELPLPTDFLTGGAAGKEGGGGGGGVPQIPGVDLGSASEQLSKAVRVVKLEIVWGKGTKQQRLPVVFHVINTTGLL